MESYLFTLLLFIVVFKTLRLMIRTESKNIITQKKEKKTFNVVHERSRESILSE